MKKIWEISSKTFQGSLLTTIKEFTLETQLQRLKKKKSKELNARNATMPRLTPS
jgi:hypothetical protein